MALRPERLYLAGTAKYRARATKEEAQRRLLGRGTKHASSMRRRSGRDCTRTYRRWRDGVKGSEDMATADGGNFI